MQFAWDPRKAAANRRKHGVTFEEAVTCFADPLALLLEDRAYPERLVLIGTSSSERLIFTVYAEVQQDFVRIISARRATRPERRRYEEGTD